MNVVRLMSYACSDKSPGCTFAPSAVETRCCVDRKYKSSTDERQVCMARIKQLGPGRKTTGTIDGVTYVTRNGITYVRSTPTMPASAYNTPAAKKRQAIFKFVQMHLKLHQRTIKQTFTPKVNGSATNRYYSINGKALTLALDSLAELYLEGQDATIDDVEAAISAYAAEHPKAITIASKSGYNDVYLTGEWPEIITLNAQVGDSTVIVIVAENGVRTTINADGTTSVSTEGTSTSSGGSSTGSGTGEGNGSGGSSTGSETAVVAAPTISGETPFDESTQVTISGPDGAEIRYTTDGTAPNAESSLYSEAITLSDTATVKAIAIKNGASSEVATKVFTKNGSNVGSGGFETGN